MEETVGKLLLTVDKVEQFPSPRVIRPHIPFYLLPPQLLDTSKVISAEFYHFPVKNINADGLQVVYVARNPKDVIVSYYFHHKLIKIHGFEGNMEEFAQYFMNDEGNFHPLLRS